MCALALLCSYGALLLATSACRSLLFLFFFFNDTATTEIYTLSLHDALPISAPAAAMMTIQCPLGISSATTIFLVGDRKSTRLNSSHTVISYAVFCLKKKKKWEMTVVHK